MTHFTAFIRSEDGATAIEYSLIAGIVSISIVAGLTSVTGNLNELFQSVVDAFVAALN